MVEIGDTGTEGAQPSKKGSAPLLLLSDHKNLSQDSVSSSPSIALTERTRDAAYVEGGKK